MPDMSASKEQWIITGDLYLDNKGSYPLLLPIGPFDTQEDAQTYLWNMKPFSGSYEIGLLQTPQSQAERAARPTAASFLTR